MVFLLPAAEKWLLPLPVDLHQCNPVDADRPRGDLRTGAHDDDVPTPDEAVTKANNSPYGLSAGVDREVPRAMGMAAALRSGVIWDNTFNRFDPAASFGGYKESGSAERAGHRVWPPT